MNHEELKKYVESNLKVNSTDIFSFNYNNQKYWLKKARETQSSFTHKLYYKLFPFEVLLPVKYKTAEESIVFETTKIESFKQMGICTPNIALKTKEYFVLEDCGKNVNSYIRKRDISKDTMRYFIDKLIDTLVLIHNNNQFHGGAQARNFIYNNGTIYVIDLEDSFENDIDLKLLQFRDLVLLLLSFTKTRASFDFDYKYVIDTYVQKSKNKDFEHRLYLMSKKLSWLISVSDLKVVNRFLGRDVKGFFNFLKALQSL